MVKKQSKKEKFKITTKVPLYRKKKKEKYYSNVTI